jgi:hypothetical protein
MGSLRARATDAAPRSAPACCGRPQSSAALPPHAADAAEAAPGEAEAIAHRFELHETLQLCAVELPQQLTGVRTRTGARTRLHAHPAD